MAQRLELRSEKPTATFSGWHRVFVHVFLRRAIDDLISMAGKDYDVVKEAASRDGASRRPTTETRGARAQLLATNVLLIAHVRFVAATKVCVSKLHLSRAGSVRRSAPGRPFLKHTQELLGSTPGVVYAFQALCKGKLCQVFFHVLPGRVSA